MALKLSLTTPVEETKTTNQVRLRKISLTLDEAGNHTAFVEYVEGNLTGETFTEYRAKTARLPTTELTTELNKTTGGTESNEAAFLKAIYDALVAAGAIGSGTVA